MQGDHCRNHVGYDSFVASIAVGGLYFGSEGGSLLRQSEGSQYLFIEHKGNHFGGLVPNQQLCHPELAPGNLFSAGQARPCFHFLPALAAALVLEDEDVVDGGSDHGEGLSVGLYVVAELCDVPGSIELRQRLVGGLGVVGSVLHCGVHFVDFGVDSADQYHRGRSEQLNSHSLHDHPLPHQIPRHLPVPDSQVDEQVVGEGLYQGESEFLAVLHLLLRLAHLHYLQDGGDVLGVKLRPGLVDFGESEELIGFGINQCDLIWVVDPDPSVFGVEALLEAVVGAFLEVPGGEGQFDAFLDVVLLDDGSGERFGGMDVLEGRFELVVAVGGDRSESLLSGHFYYYNTPSLATLNAYSDQHRQLSPSPINAALPIAQNLQRQ